MPLLDLDGGGGPGAVWGTATADLNLTLVSWPAGAGVPEHVNAGRDVLLVVVSGTGVLVEDGAEHALAPGRVALVPMGAARAVRAADGGLRYLTAHRRRGGLEVAPARRESP